MIRCMCVFVHNILLQLHSVHACFHGVHALHAIMHLFLHGIDTRRVRANNIFHEIELVMETLYPFCMSVSKQHDLRNQITIDSEIDKLPNVQRNLDSLGEIPAGTI